MSYYAEWAKIYDSSFMDMTTGTVVDSKGNIIVIGTYQTDFGSTKPFVIDFGSSKVQKLNSGVYAIKYNNVGVIQWVKFIIERSDTNITNPTRVQVDNNDNIYITGNINIGGSFIITSSGTLTSNKVPAGYFIKLDPTGNILWGKMYDYANVNNITIDRNNDSYITGEVTDVAENLSFITSSGTVTRPNYGNRLNGSFIVKHNSDGTAIWAKFLDMTNLQERGYGVTCDTSGYIYQLVSVNGTYPIKIDTASGPFYSTNNKSVKYFIIKYNAENGVIMYIQQFFLNTDSLETTIQNILFNPTTSRLYCLMQATGTSNTAVSIVTTSGTVISQIYTEKNNNKQLWLLYFDSETLKTQWARIIDGASDETLGSLTIDSIGRVYVIGNTTTNGLIIQTSSGPVVNPYNDTGSIFIARFLESNIIDWAMFYNNNNAIQYGSSISTDIYGNFFISGYTSSSSVSVSGYVLYNASGYSIQTSSGTISRPYDEFSNAFLIKFTTGPSAYISALISPLSVGSTYYIRSVVQNTTGIEYSPLTYIYKHIVYGSIRIKSIINIISNYADVILEVSSLGGESNVRIGFVLSSTKTLPTIDPNGGYINGYIKDQNISNVGDYLFNGIGNVTANTIYYIRPFIITSRGIYYGEVNILRTAVALPEIFKSGDITGVTNNQANFNVRLSNVGGQNTYFGYVYSSTNPNPSIEDSYFETPQRYPRDDPNELNVKLTESIYLSTYGYELVTGLSPNTLYYIRAFGRNDAGYIYDNTVYTFQTLPNPPTLGETTLISINYK